MDLQFYTGVLSVCYPGNRINKEAEDKCTRRKFSWPSTAYTKQVQDHGESPI